MNERAENQRRFLKGVYSKIARRYELANHILTFGLDMYWRRKAAKLAIVYFARQREETGDVIAVPCGQSGAFTRVVPGRSGAAEQRILQPDHPDQAGPADASLLDVPALIGLVGMFGRAVVRASLLSEPTCDIMTRVKRRIRTRGTSGSTS